MSRIIAPSNEKRQGRLLIIDDEDELREVLAIILEDYVAEIKTARNGEEAIEILKQERFNAVLSDEKMPKKTGLEVLKWMKASNINTPFIIHTGYGQKETIEQAQALQVFGFLDKPWQEDKLVTLVQAAIHKDLGL
ncbi:MAG: response regulator [Bdellovibrionia bacterium]